LSFGDVLEFSIVPKEKLDVAAKAFHP